MNKTCKALDKETYELIIKTIRNGFVDEEGGYEFKPNNRLATILVVQANFGCRIIDILNLRLNDIVRENGRYHLDIVEQKTGKKRNFTVPDELYDFLKQYVEENRINPLAKIFPVCERAVQKQLKIVTDYLGLDGIGTHSFRKFYATSIYELADYDITVVQTLLQHSSVFTTQRYIGINQKKVEDVIQKHICIA